MYKKNLSALFWILVTEQIHDFAHNISTAAVTYSFSSFDYFLALSGVSHFSNKT